MAQTHETAPVQREVDLEHLFAHHPPNAEQARQHQALRAGALAFAQVLVANTPRCADQTNALRKIREALMVGNAAIALQGRG